MEFDTKRLSIKKFIPEYIEVMYDVWGTDKDIGMYIPGFRIDWNLDEFGEYILKKYKDECHTRLIIQEKKSNNIIGNISLYQEDSTSKSIIMWIKKDYWNMGYGNEILKALIKELKKQKMLTIYATCDGRNIGAIKILEKNNFELIDKIEGERKDLDGNVGDEYLYELDLSK